MAKNLIPKIAEMLGVGLGEKFKVVSINGNEYIGKFTSLGLLTYATFPQDGRSGVYSKELLAYLVCGEAKIIKLPWKPSLGDTFYTFTLVNGKWIVGVAWWNTEPRYYALLDKGWIYRSRAEAEAALPSVAAEMGVDYEL